MPPKRNLPDKIACGALVVVVEKSARDAFDVAAAAVARAATSEVENLELPEHVAGGMDRRREHRVACDHGDVGAASLRLSPRASS